MQSSENLLRTSEDESANPDWVRIGARLSSIRGSRSQLEMAKVLHVSKNTYGRWERGERELGVGALMHLAAEGADIAWLVTGRASREPAAIPEGMGIDAAILCSAIETVDAVLEMPNTPEFSPRGRARLVAALYQHWLQEQPESATAAVSMAIRTIVEAVKTGDV